MMIYKYVDSDTLRLILQGERIMFTQPADFNDPFDRPRVSRAAYGSEYRSLFTGELMTREMQAEEADAAWERCAISSFTRTYDNALMWAHYADKHHGAVIEIDAETAGLTNKEFLIPIQFGSVIYMKRPSPDLRSTPKPGALGTRTVKRGDNRFEIENYAGLQRLFLTKGLSWAYEEEVRVVADDFVYAWDHNNEYPGGAWKKIDKPDGKQGYGWRLKRGSITRVFSGLRYQKIDELREFSSIHGFGIMRADAARRNDYEVHFLLDESTEG